MPTLLGLDTETTGLTPPIGVVELACVRVSEQLEVLDEYAVLVNPGRPIEPGATRVHGITDDEVAGAISLEAALAPYSGEEVVVIGHNIQFDLRLVGPHLNVVGDLCTLALSRQYVKGSANHKLSTVVAHLGLPDFKAHRALGDVFSSLNVLRHILAETGLKLEQVIQRQSKPRMLLTMPFGKHAGMPITQVPWTYRQWLLQQANLDKDLRYTLQQLSKL